MTHKGTVTLTTERLILRRYTPDDADAMFRNLFTRLGDTAEAVGEFMRTNWLESYSSSESYQWVIELKGLNEPIGTLRADCVDTLRRSLELGYEIGEQWWHQGIMTEAAKRVIAFFFDEVGLNRISARHNATNPRSGGVMINCGMRYEGRQRQASKTGCDVLIYAILADDYFGGDKPSAPLAANILSLKSATDLMFFNLSISMKTCDWQADVGGAPVWRYIYHTIHSCDKYFINPHVFSEPPFHTPGLDWPDNPTDVVLTEMQLSSYYEQTRVKILTYLDSLTDAQLLEAPEQCNMNRLELILSQFRHMYAHIGILNGITIAHTGEYPRVINESRWKSHALKPIERLFEEWKIR